MMGSARGKMGYQWGFIMDNKESVIENEGEGVRIVIAEGTERIERNTYTGTKNVVIHTPGSVRFIAQRAISPEKTNEVKVFYQGTKAEWDDIVKGHHESWCEEDYHRIGMGVSRTIFVDWAVNNRRITIHCLDGDILTKDRSYRDC